MYTIKLNIEDDFYPHIKAMLESLARDRKLEIIDNETTEGIIVNSIEEVRRRARDAEASDNLTDAEYEVQMDHFFKEELGISR